MRETQTLSLTWWREPCPSYGVRGEAAEEEVVNSLDEGKEMAVRLSVASVGEIR